VKVESKSVLDKWVGEALKGVGQVVLTGGSSGIGWVFIHSIARVEPGLPICNLSRQESPEFEDSVAHYGCDFSRPVDRREVFEQLEVDLREKASTGRILLINNAGFGSYGAFSHPDLGVSLDMIAVNISAVVELTGLLLPLMKERGGAILNMASTSAFQPTPYMSTYGGTKAFLLNWTLGLNEELRGSGVSALAVCPGPTETNFQVRAGFRKEGSPPRNGQSAEDVVRISFEALVRGKVVVICGLRNRLIAWLAMHSPKVLVARVAGKLIRQTRLKGVEQ
jgi:short-subunit dehydrogenase